ncbi:MAG: ABC transporter ATP-binding protein [Sulfuricella sp.]|nr:ABC transporter ATP-binding protein [Sulfuricella sp.]
MLQTERLTLTVPGRTLCEGLSVTIEAGQCWAILGGNGSGKSTLLHVLSGLTTAHSGHASLDDKPLHDYSRSELARRIGVLLQDEAAGFWGTVAEYTLLGRFPHGDRDTEIASAALHRLGLAVLAERRYPSLSGGERQRVRIAQLLTQNPRLCLLDEPLQHLDLRHQAEAMALFRDVAAREQRAVVLVLHEPWWAARFCSHVLLLYGDGETAHGLTAEMLTPANLERLYGYRLPADWMGIAPVTP